MICEISFFTHSIQKCGKIIPKVEGWCEVRNDARTDMFFVLFQLSFKKCDIQIIGLE